MDLSNLKDYEFSTFLIGVKGEDREEKKFWKEKIKEEIKKQFPKARIDFKEPDVIITYDPQRKEFSFYVKSLFIKGKYNKLVRGIPQTKWPCRRCKGKGCERCSWKGKMYEESVEEIIGAPILRESKGEKTKFHGMGREDIDALCLGKRPFVIEITSPKKRKIDLKKIEKEINSSGKVEVFELDFCTKEIVRKYKMARADKEYRVLVKCEEKLSNEDIEKISDFKGTIEQRTPFRVLHRRANVLRKRKIKKIEAKLMNENEFEAKIIAEHGTYIKEFVSGDNGRTKPSISSIIGKKCWVEELDVVKIFC